MGSGVNKKAFVEVGSSQQLKQMINEERRYLIGVDVYSYADNELDIDLEIEDLKEHYELVEVFAECDVYGQCNFMCPWYSSDDGCKRGRT
jgi:hypothetical protein